MGPEPLDQLVDAPDETELGETFLFLERTAKLDHSDKEGKSQAKAERASEDSLSRARSRTWSAIGSTCPIECRIKNLGPILNAKAHTAPALMRIRVRNGLCAIGSSSSPVPSVAGSMYSPERKGGPLRPR